MSQHQKVIDLCIKGDWVCQNEFRAQFIFSPHKRRVEIEGRKNRAEQPKGRYIFDERKCEHGINGQKDYRMRENPDYYTPTQSTQKALKSTQETPESRQMEQQKLLLEALK